MISIFEQHNGNTLIMYLKAQFSSSKLFDMFDGNKSKSILILFHSFRLGFWLQPRVGWKGRKSQSCNRWITFLWHFTKINSPQHLTFVYLLPSITWIKFRLAMSAICKLKLFINCRFIEFFTMHCGPRGRSFKSTFMIENIPDERWRKMNGKKEI